MKVSELINQLTELMDEWGDLPVNVHGYFEGDEGISVDYPAVYNKDGDHPASKEDAVEIYLH